jgi:hypothetical protein
MYDLPQRGVAQILHRQRILRLRQLLGCGP